MNLSLGIDIGSSSTKAAALDEHGTLLGTLQVHADDPRTSAYGVLGRFLDQQGASFNDVEKIVLTGLGSTYFHENIFGIPTIHALELDAIGHGGLYLSGLDEALVVSLGTGSAFIRASRTNGFRHLGGNLSLLLKRGTRNVVLTGSLASLAPAAKTFDIFNQMHDVFGIDYIIPPHPSFATAVGALLCEPLPEN